MASVCGSTLALMDTGYRSSTGSGVAMGLIKEGGIMLLTDIAAPKIILAIVSK
jgi:polyribonucleotide nucleotidyltransferase